MRTRTVLLVAAVALGCGGTERRPDTPDGPLRPGAPAPDVRGEDQTGTIRRLSAERGHLVVVYFYPKDGTPGCTREACAFRDAWDRLEAAGVRVWGISADSLESHAAFAREHGLRFPLLSDPSLRWAAAFGVGSTLGLAHRVSFLVGPDGRIAHTYPDVDPAVHVDQILADVAALGGGAHAAPPAPDGGAAASVPTAPADGGSAALRPIWPDRICAVPTSGVPSAVRVETCNCGQTVSCEVQVRSGTARLFVREDPRTMAACDDCLQTVARCPILTNLTPRHAILRVNDDVSVDVETDEIGMLVPGRCWDVPPPSPARPGASP